MKSIPKDTWQLLLSFIDQVNDNLKNYDPNGIITFQFSSIPSELKEILSFQRPHCICGIVDCWPIAIDDFVDFVKSSESSS